MTNARHANANENLTLRFKVKDFNAWRTSYDGNEKGRASAGITNGKVFRGADDQNEVIVLQDVADVAKSRTWLGSEDLKAAMQKSGVIGSPSIRFNRQSLNLSTATGPYSPLPPAVRYLAAQRA
jgi:hypothetical protein